MKSNEKVIRGTTYINLATHPVAINAFGTLFRWDSNPGEKPELLSKYKIKKGTYPPEYEQTPSEILNLPEPRDGVKLIVPLFIITGVESLVKRGLMERRDDLLSPGKKVFGEGGKILYADGFKTPSYD